MTKDQKNYIRKNRKKKSMNDMSIFLGISYTKIRNFMIQNNLSITKKQAYKIRSDKLKRLKNQDLKRDWDAIP